MGGGGRGGVHRERVSDATKPRFPLDGGVVALTIVSLAFGIWVGTSTNISIGT